MKVFKLIIAIAILVLVTMFLFNTAFAPNAADSSFGETDESYCFDLSAICTSIHSDFSEYSQHDEEYCKRNREFVHSLLGLDTTD